MVNRYGLFVFAEADHSRARRPGKGIDALIEKWEFGKSRINASQACQQAASLLASKVTGNTLVLVSTRPSENSVKPMQKALENVLGSKAGKIVDMGDFLSNEDAARLANGADLLIVEEKYESSTDRMRREAEILSLQSVNVLGSVVL
jgi:ribonuclease BN (tRNA processing enzyme)